PPDTPPVPPASGCQTTWPRPAASIRSPGSSRELRLTTKQDQDDPPPSLHPHYRGFTATTRRSAPLPRTGTLPLCRFSCLESSLTPTGLNMPIGSIAARGSHVPHRRLIRARATFMPDTAWPGPQAPARLIPGQDPGPGSDAVHTLSALQQWFTRVRLPGSHLTHHVRLFRSAHHPGSFAGPACGGFGPLPA